MFIPTGFPIKALPLSIYANKLIRFCQKFNLMFTYIPDNESVVVLTTEGGKVLLIERERKTLYQNFMQFQSVLHLERLEVPNYYIGLQLKKHHNFQNFDTNALDSEVLRYFHHQNPIPKHQDYY